MPGIITAAARLLIATLAVSCATLALAKEPLATQIDLPYERFVLDNGLTVLVHSDHSTPTVFVGMWYGVGSKDEPDGKTGFAHLFEHLMFQGTENRDGEYFSPFTKAGATGMNGTTNEDRTNYYATVPSGALDMALWMESDRMAYLLGAVTQDALDEQRGVVQNEKRQGESRPYAQMYDKQRAGLYPVDHPYRHSIIGSMDDLDAATLDDVHEWFETYYGASNVVLVLAGDVTVEDARQKVAYYFDEVPAGVPLSEPQQRIPDLRENRTEHMYDRVGQTRISRTWALPGRGVRDTTLFYLINESLLANKNSPLQKVLVDELQLATDIRGGAYGRVMSGEYNITVNLRDGVDPEQAMRVVDEVIAEYLASGPDEQIVENARLAVKMFILGGLETGAQIGRLLVQGELFNDDPLFINTELEWLNEASSDELREVANRWLQRGYYQLTVEPFPDYQSAEPSVDRSAIPDVTAKSRINFPDIETQTLDNGMKLVVASRGRVPIVDIAIEIGAGSTAAPPDAPGLPAFVYGLLDKGTRSYDANELAAAKDRIAMASRLQSGNETGVLSYRILTEYLDDSFDLAAEMLRRPVFPDVELEKVKAQVGAYLANLERAPNRAASSLFDRAVYGPDNPMGAVWTPQLVADVDRDKLLSWHADEFAPDNMTIYMIGDITLERAAEAANRAFGKWKQDSDSARRAIGAAPDVQPRVILIDQPEAPSATIVAGHAIGPYDAQTSPAMTIMNRALGGGFESRLNMNLREDKGWSYGYRSAIVSNTSGDMLFRTSGQVQADKTAASMQEILREIEEFVGDNPATESEVERIRLNRVRSLPGTFATNRGFLSSMRSSASYGLPFDYAESAAERLEAVTLEDVRAIARDVVDPGRLTWVVVGDLDVIEDEVRALAFGPVEVWDAYGNRLN